MTTADHTTPNVLPLDDGLCVLDVDEVSFLLLATGIDTEEALKKHLIDVQTRAYNVGIDNYDVIFSWVSSNTTRFILILASGISHLRSKYFTIVALKIQNPIREV